MFSETFEKTSGIGKTKSFKTVIDQLKRSRHSAGAHNQNLKKLEKAFERTEALGKSTGVEEGLKQGLQRGMRKGMTIGGVGGVAAGAGGMAIWNKHKNN
jgi:hypothetical protein